MTRRPNDIVLGLFVTIGVFAIMAFVDSDQVLANVNASDQLQNKNQFQHENQNHAQATNIRKFSNKKNNRRQALIVEPITFLEIQTQRLLRLALARPPIKFNRHDTLQIRSNADKDGWLSGVYKANLVDHSAYPKAISDRRLLYHLLQSQLKDETEKYFPKTIGLKEFLLASQLIDANGNWLDDVDADSIEEALIQYFPTGFIARPAVGLAPNETRLGMFANSADFIAALLRSDSLLFQSKEINLPTRSSLIGEILSGEAIVLQESVIGSANIHKKLQNRSYVRVRVHTFENQILEEALANRWSSQTQKATTAEIKRAQSFAEEFLKRLPLPLLSRQAWSVDVAVFDQGDMRVVDILTNRGQPIAWSSYLEQPQVLGAYTRHFEAKAEVQWVGINGVLLRHDWANLGKYLKLAAEHRWDSMMAYKSPN